MGSTSTGGVFIFELLSGFPPFTDSDRRTLFNKILLNEPGINGLEVTKECKDLLWKLLEKNVEKRIPPEQIPLHPWFSSISFKDLEELKIKPPFMPRVTEDESSKQVKTGFTWKTNKRHSITEIKEGN